MQAPIKNVLVYRLGSLGDTVIALPCFHAIKQAFPQANIILLTNKPVAAKAAPLEAVLGTGLFFNETINYPVGTRSIPVLLQLWRKLFRLRIDTVVNIAAARSALSAKRDLWFFRLCGIKHCIGFPTEKRDFEPQVDAVTGEREWEAARLARRLTKLGTIDLADNRYWNMRFTGEELAAATDIIAGFKIKQPVIVVSAGTKMQSKDWGSANWVNLFTLMRAKLPNFNLVLIGSAEEFPVSQACLETWGEHGLNMAGKISPRVSGALLQHACLFIGHDSGPMHLAAAVGVPVVAVFSAQNIPRQWYPRGENNTVIYHKTDCAGCGLEVCIEQKKKCILSITAEEVLDAVMQTLTRTSVPG